MTPQWSMPYCGVSHLGRPGDRRWATIAQYDAGAELTLWCRGYPPDKKWLGGIKAAELAKGVGEDWVAGRLLGCEAVSDIIAELRRLRQEGLLDGSNVLAGLARLLDAFEREAPRAEPAPRPRSQS